MSRWVSVDQILSKYLPNVDTFKNNNKKNKRNKILNNNNDKYKKLPGIGGVFNTINLNLYHYAANNPIIFTDPDGNQIAVQVHYVALGFNHSSILIVPENQEKYKNDKRFKTDKGSGLVYATIGAGPKKFNTLVSGINRELDRDLNIKKETAVICKPDMNGKTEDQIIDVLFEKNANYNDNLDYDFFPAKEGERSWYIADDGHNSNSFVSGLLEAIGIKKPELKSNTPGYDIPVPKKNFKKAQCKIKAN